MTPVVSYIGVINILSVLYLSLVLACTLSVAEHDAVKKIFSATIRRWLKLVGVLVILSVIVHLVSSL